MAAGMRQAMITHMYVCMHDRAHLSKECADDNEQEQHAAEHAREDIELVVDLATVDFIEHLRVQPSHAQVSPHEYQSKSLEWVVGQLVSHTLGAHCQNMVQSNDEAPAAVPLSLA